MSEKQSAARKTYWASIPKEQRSIHARNAVLVRHNKMTPEEKKELSKKLNEAKKACKLSQLTNFVGNKEIIKNDKQIIWKQNQ